MWLFWISMLWFSGGFPKDLFGCVIRDPFRGCWWPPFGWWKGHLEEAGRRTFSPKIPWFSHFVLSEKTKHWLWRNARETKKIIEIRSMIFGHVAKDFLLANKKNRFENKVLNHPAIGDQIILRLLWKALDIYVNTSWGLVFWLGKT